MKKLFFAFALILVYVSASAGNIQYNQDSNWCPTRSKIVVVGGVFDGKYISCPKGLEQTCVHIAEDLEDLYKSIDAKDVWLGYDNEFNSKINEMEKFQSQKLAEFKSKKTPPFFYSLKVSLSPIHMSSVTDSTCANDKDAGGSLEYAFNLVSTEKNKNLNKGKPAGPNEPADYVALVGQNIFIAK